MRAVDCPALHHLVNLVVFPLCGPRSHANETSGGDLDGDEFLVVWEPSLIPCESVSPSAEYVDEPHETAAVELDRNAILDFFERFVRMDNLSTIANSHIAWADSHPGAAMGETCLELARLHSVAVDFSQARCRRAT